MRPALVVPHLSQRMEHDAVHGFRRPVSQLIERHRGAILNQILSRNYATKNVCVGAGCAYVRVKSKVTAICVGCSVSISFLSIVIKPYIAFVGLPVEVESERMA